MNREKLLEYKEVSEQLKKIKALEMSLRVEICDELLRDKEEGTHKMYIDGVDVKAVCNLNMRLDVDELAMLAGKLTPEELEAIDYKPSLSKTKYKKLSSTSNIDNCIIVTPAAPSLTVTIPEEEV